jgi:L-ribulokinase
MRTSKYTIGVDFGTDSVRTLIIDCSNGREISSSLFQYPRWKAGKYCNPAKNQFRQHPLDYIEGLEFTIKDALQKAPPGTAQSIVAIAADTTGSTPVAVNREGIPLSLNPEFAENPNAMFILWKDHTALKEASEINFLARNWRGEDYTKYEGGVYSSEWFWAKLLHVIRQDTSLYKSAFSWVEHCDWIPALLTGNIDPLSLKRSRCAAGHKAMWHSDWHGLPSEAFLCKLDPLLKGLRERLFIDTYTSDVRAGTLSSEWAGRLGLPINVAVAVGGFDAHLGAVGGEIKPYYLSKVMGTSTCDMLVAPRESLGNHLVKGICGQVDGSVIPGMIGLEAGQSAFGDVYAWFRNLILWPVEQILSSTNLIAADSRDILLEQISDNIIPLLSVEAEKIAIEESGIIALDWLNGRRAPDANQEVKGAITGLSLGSDAPRIFRALVEATAFGAKRIVDRFIDEGIRIDGIIALGGVAKKSPFVMQVVCDVLNKPIQIARSEQACALGSAMAASVAGGIYTCFEDAQLAMGSGFEKVYRPIEENSLKYQLLYQKYCDLGLYIENQ